MRFLLAAAIIAAGVWYAKNKLGVPQQPPCSCAFTEEDLDAIRERLHIFLKGIRPDIPDEQIAGQVMLITEIKKA